MLLEKIESTGIKLAVVEDDLLQITGEISDQQLNYLRSNKQKLIVALRLRPIAEKYGHDLDDLLSWYRNDVGDLVSKSDADLEFIVNDYIHNQGVYRHFKPVPHCVKCISCKHFVRSDHPHLGKCAAGVNQTAPAGFWDTHLRGCGEFIEVDTQ
jgi:hypothetical protein